MKATDIYEKAKKEIVDFIKYEIKQIFEADRRNGLVDYAEIDAHPYDIDPEESDVQIGTLYLCGEGTSYDDGVMYSVDAIFIRYISGEVYIVDEYDNERNLETDFPMESIVLVADALEKIYHKVIK